jgi:hypothetical protein
MEKLDYHPCTQAEDIDMKSFKARLSMAVNRAGRVTFRSTEMEWIDKVAMIKAKAEAYIANNPAPRALFLL